MATLLRFDMPRTGGGRRWTAGVLVSSKCTQAAAALIAADGHGTDAQARAAGAVTAEIPNKTVALFGSLAGTPGASAGSIALLRAQLAEIEAALMADLLSGLGVAPSRVLAVGVHDPGLWHTARGEPAGYLGLCDAARLAEATGLNVIDAFPARDLAQGGLGGPITAMSQWMLLRHAQRGRVVLDLGRTVQISYLPPTLADKAASRILSFEAGPGTAMLDLLAERLTGGRHRFDPGGRLAVQGRRIPELLEHWLSDPYFDRPLPRWHPQGVRPERFLSDSMQMAVDFDWSVRDLLCSATHFIAETIVRAISRRLPEDARISEVVIAGGGQQNGMLLREIGRATKLPLVRIGDLGYPDDAFGPACIALLALLHLDQVPANATAVTKTDVPRLLGRLTPGSPQNWQRLLQACAGSSPAVRPLRSAV
ncbi:MAG: anhydro-N-acetylmuramic acid kinase [Pirellulales bacterium]|nr:anhydro-N-acetylmuramic acid kinase [Pirellulales bacterium]